MNELYDVLKTSKASDFLIREEQTESREAFFIGQKLDMSRAKKVTHTFLTVFVDSEDGKFRGSAEKEIHQGISREEMKQEIDQALFAAQFVQNPWYPVAEPSDAQASADMADASRDLTAELVKLVQAMQEIKAEEDSRVNSYEIFVNQKQTHIRNSRGVSLTAEGQVLFQHVEAAFEALERGENELKQIQNLHIGQLKIGVSNTLCKYILLPYLKGFIAQYPHVRILIESQDTARTISMLEQQKLDIGLIAEDTFVCTRSYLENLRIREGADVDPFESGTILLLDRSNMTRTHIDAYFAEHGIEPKQILEATTMDLLIEFAKTGLGIGCVIREFVREELKDGSLIELPLEVPIRNRTIGFAYHPTAMTRTMNDFVQFCSE